MLKKLADSLVKNCAQVMVVLGQNYQPAFSHVQKLVGFAPLLPSLSAGFYTRLSASFTPVGKAFLHILHKAYYYNYYLKNIDLAIGPLNFCEQIVKPTSLRGVL